MMGELSQNMQSEMAMGNSGRFLPTRSGWFETARRRTGAELRRLGPTLVPGFLHDRGDLGVGDEALPTRRIPVEEHPDPVVLVGIAKDGRTLGPVLLSLLGALGREDFQKAVVVLDLCRCQ